MNVLELFSGTASFSNAAKERGYNTVTVDNNPKFEPDICVDVHDWDYPALNQTPGIIWASPPCTCFSVMQISRNWERTETGYNPKRPETITAIGLVERAIAIIRYFKPRYWFIENPRGMLRKMPFMADLPRKTVTYCKYGMPYQKATDIWTNLDAWQSRPVCSAGDPCHSRAPRGSRLGLQGIDGYRENRKQKHYPSSSIYHNASVSRAIVPRELCDELLDVIESQTQ